jgi:O-methyltransferase
MLTGKLKMMFLKRKIETRIVYKSDLRDFSSEELTLYSFVQPYTMTSPERVKALIDSVKYIVGNCLEGAFVECGVWKGGSVIAMLKVLESMGQEDREIFLFDTFGGMSEPTDYDVDPQGVPAKVRLCQEDKIKSNVWANASLDEVKVNITKVQYPLNRIHFIEGKVESTLERNKPSKIALLRLDTDWYESTKVELEQLYDLVVPRGIIIIDDYGHWNGCKKAVDEFMSTRKEKILLQRIDYTGRLIIK